MEQEHPIPAPTVIIERSARPRDPPLYTGLPKEDLATWLFRMEQYFLFLGNMSETAKIVTAATFFSEVPYAWYRRGSEEGRFQVMTWEQFKEELMATFLTMDHTARARDRLATLSQKRSVQEYYSAFQAILFDIPTMHEDDQMDHFLRHLKPSILGFRV